MGSLTDKAGDPFVVIGWSEEYQLNKFFEEYRKSN
jgi:hypothetical protein